MPARTSPGQTRSALSSPSPGGSEKLTRAGCVVKIGSANVGTMEEGKNGQERSGEVVEMAAGGALTSVVYRRHEERERC